MKHLTNQVRLVEAINSVRAGKVRSVAFQIDGVDNTVQKSFIAVHADDFEKISIALLAIGIKVVQGVYVNLQDFAEAKKEES